MSGVSNEGGGSGWTNRIMKDIRPDGIQQLQRTKIQFDGFELCHGALLLAHP